MDTYSLLRQIADSWVLLAMFGFFVAVVVWAFRPGASRTYRDTANMIFRNEKRPASGEAAAKGQGFEEAKR